MGQFAISEVSLPMVLGNFMELNRRVLQFYSVLRVIREDSLGEKNGHV